MKVNPKKIMNQSVIRVRKLSVSLKCSLVNHIFFFWSDVNTNKADGFPTREHATYSCPCEKQWFSKFIPQTLSDWPCDFLITIANARRTEKCNRLKSNGRRRFRHSHFPTQYQTQPCRCLLWRTCTNIWLILPNDNSQRSHVFWKFVIAAGNMV